MGRFRSVTASVVACSVVCLLAVAALVATASSRDFARERRETEDLLAGAAAAVGPLLGTVQDDAGPVLLDVAANPGVAAFDPDACTAALAPLASITETARLVILDPAGRAVCSLPAGVGLDGVPEAQYAGALAGGTTYTGDVLLDPVNGNPTVTMAVPVDGATGTGAAVVLLYTSIPAIDVPAAVDPSTAVVVVDPASGIVMATTPESPFAAGSTVDWTAPPEHGPDGVDRLWRSAPIAGTGWQVFAGLGRAEAFADADSKRRSLLLLGGAILALVVALGVSLQRRLARPVRRLGEAIDAIGAGDDGARAPETGPTEVAEVARAFNALADSQRLLLAQLHHSATHDPLTALPNRRGASAELERLLADPGAEPLSVLFIDLDRFKLVNDTYGHSVGDELLVVLAGRLRSCVPAHWIVTRFGGDEFVVLCPATPDPLPEVERIAALLRSSIVVDGHELAVGGSIGVAVARPGMAGEDLVREADTAMYRAKEAGGDGFAVYDDAMQVSTMQRLTTERDLRGAAERGELVLHHQPVVDLASGDVVSVEALVRWLHPDRGLLAPAAFVPVAEETGLILDVGRWVLEEAAAQAAAWRAAGTPVRIAVNVAAAQLVRADLAAAVARTLRRAGCRPEDVVVEVTESAVLTDVDAAIAQLDALRRLGVRVALDDFGTGFSSLGYLQRLPVDELKIDRSFVVGIGSSPVSEAIVASVIDLAHGIGLTVVAEGVEEVEQLEWLRARGCDRAQGYLIARPRPADHLALPVPV